MPFDIPSRFSLKFRLLLLNDLAIVEAASLGNLGYRAEYLFLGLVVVSVAPNVS